jgi:adenylate cyclase
MPDIFISYSRKDSAQALQLIEQLRASGIDVWVDQRGIAGSEKWATEIAEAIRACPTFLLMISPDSMLSDNVLKELSLASEKRKRILPVDLIPSEIPTSFEYALSGLQRISISDFDGIVRAHKHGVSRVAIKDSRKSLIVLPFEDLSPGQDNAWFANGLTSELIDMLSHIKSLRLIDRKTSMDLKGFHGKTIEIANALQVRYFIEGTVRKFGKQIKISVSLLDIETGDYLWQESQKGMFEDIFDIQEAVAQKVIEGLKVHLTEEEKTRITERGTENAEAYELFVKASEYFRRQTKDGIQLTIQLLTEAIKLDPSYAHAHSFKANALASLYSAYERDPALLDQGMEDVSEALRLRPDMWGAYHPLSRIYQLQGKLEEAEQAAKTYVQNAPEDPGSHSGLGFFYASVGQPANAIAHSEQAAKLKPENLAILWNLIVCCNAVSNEEKQFTWAHVAIPHFERHLKLFPDAESVRVSHSVLLHYAGRNEDAREAARRLENISDGAALFNMASLQCNLQDHEAAIRTFRKAIEAGFRNIQYLTIFLNNEQDGIANLRGTTEYEEVKLMVEKIQAESASTQE